MVILVGSCIFVMKETLDFQQEIQMKKKEQDLKFFLNNGQEDCYPRNWCYLVKTLEIAMIFFLKNGEKPNNVEWHDDSL